MGQLQSLEVAIQCSNAVALKTTCTQCTSLITNYVHIKEHASVHSTCACVQLATGFEAGQKWLTSFEMGQRLWIGSWHIYALVVYIILTISMSLVGVHECCCLCTAGLMELTSLLFWNALEPFTLVAWHATRKNSWHPVETRGCHIGPSVWGLGQGGIELASWKCFTRC